MRFQVSRVMDTIEQRLTTDVTLAQAVVDLAEVARLVRLDGGRSINLLRIGMVVDALGRYLIDAGAMLYPVAGRELLSEAALTSKERMVLSRWADDGLIEITPVVADRAVEIADFTGIPLIVTDVPGPYASRFPWLDDSPERVLRLTPRDGRAVLAPSNDTTIISAQPSTPAIAIGKAVLRKLGFEKQVKVDTPLAPGDAEALSAVETSVLAMEAPAVDAAVGAEAGDGAGARDAVETGDGAEAGEETTVPAGSGEPGAPTSGSITGPAIGSITGPATEAAGGPAADAPVDEHLAENFTAHGIQRFTRVRVVRRRFTRADPSGIGASLAAREWRCAEPDCPAFGQYRRIGQPVPRMRAGVPACPRHGQPVKDIGPRRPAYAVSLVVDDLARCRFVVAAGRSVVVGRDPKDPDDVTVGHWLHEAAADWIADEHLRLEVRGASLVVTDTSENGTLVWKRTGPNDAGETSRLYGQSHTLGEWDSLELYTGVELVHGDRRLATTVGSEPLSVLVDAPTVALRLPDFGS